MYFELSLAFTVITILSMVCIYFATSRNKRVLLLYVSWAGIIGMLSYNQFFQNADSMPPRMLFALLPALGLTVVVYRIVKIHAIDIKWLIGVNVLRFPIELILFQLYEEGMIPQRMTFEGLNWDILSGISAVILMTMYFKHILSTKGVVIWNFVALLLLMAIICLAILSVPSPFQLFDFDQPNIAVLYYPFTWLPAVVVPIVLLSHLLIFKKLITNK